MNRSARQMLRVWMLRWGHAEAGWLVPRPWLGGSGVRVVGDSRLPRRIGETNHAAKRG